MARSQIEEIKDKLDILEVARSYISDFKKSGSNYFALCPFHQEKTPSFSVNSDLGIFKCFGCGESGDVITFIEKMEGVDFPKALEIAAKKAGVVLNRNFSKKDEKLYKEKQELLKLNSLVTEYYNYILIKHKNGEKGREYIKKRKITKDLIEKFKIGYAPRSYNSLINFLKSKGYKIKDLIKWGLVVSVNGRIYDKFRSRLIFPLIDHHDDIVGFSGRTILKNTRAPKYLHSPQTITFNKSKFLFGLNQAKKEVRKKDFVIFCEGQLDVISSNKTRFKNTVASLGTSLNQEQLKLAKRYTDDIYFSFDNDMAGETALIRASNISHNLGFNVKAIIIKGSTDADELINKNKSAWERTVKKAEPIVDHMIRRLYKRLDLSDLKNKEEFSKIILPIISSIPSKIEQAHYLHRVSLILNIDEAILTEELEEIKDIPNNRIQIDIQRIKKLLESPVNIKEEYLLSLIFQHIEFIDTSLKLCKKSYFKSPLAKELFSKLEKYYKEKKRFSIKNFTSSLEKHELIFIQNLLLKKLQKYFKSEIDLKEEIESIVIILKKIHLQEKIKSIKNKIEKAENKKNNDEVKKFLDKLMTATDKLSKI